ncbi:hypothetical protein CsSME_00018825 [Camellia sinensis var. sinensis]
MGSICIPVIDMKEDSVGQSEKIVEACREWGCFRIINHGVPPELMAEMKVATQSLMELPVEIKRRRYHPVESHGYVSVNKVSPVYESLLACHDSCVPGALDNFLDLMAVSPHLRKTVVKYFEAINEQALDMGRKLGEGMGLKGDLFKDWSSQMRLNKYHFNPEFVGSCALYLHTDPGFLTILQDDEIVGGLEVVHGKTGECVHVDPMPDSLLVNLGDMATIWSNGRLPSVKHRVQCYEVKTRFSIVFFVFGPNDRATEQPPELVDSQHPRLYNPINFADYRLLRLSNNLRTGAFELLRINS